jgi:hypothetical protein
LKKGKSLPQSSLRSSAKDAKQSEPKCHPD